jgi:hypothetical protein
VLGYVVICGATLIESREWTSLCQVLQHLKRLPPVIDRSGSQAADPQSGPAVRSYRRQAWIKADRFPRYSLLLTKMKRCPPNIRKRTSSFQRRISLQNVSHTNTHTAGPLVARVSFPPVFETATSLAECRTTSKLPNISFSCAYLAVFNLKADLTPLQIT